MEIKMCGICDKLLEGEYNRCPKCDNDVLIEDVEGLIKLLLAHIRDCDESVLNNSRYEIEDFKIGSK
ncbi:hypothetical protein LCGC14_1451390 [marine sediment metagenome]|uniref:Uncharacterized protein n=1 Tax=marine sediment metagenome TaxID=412755 RepID=A0A0F9JHM6_9ZZZZ